MIALPPAKLGESPRPVMARLDGLTGLRFFAAIYVVVFHYATPALLGAPRGVLNVALSGYVAVDFFFILSGFILAYNYMTPAGAFKGTRRRFWVARFARIYPAYALSFLLCLPMVARATFRGTSTGLAFYRFLRSLGIVAVMQQSWLPWMALWGNAPAWSLSVEAFFYLIFPLAAFCLGKLSVRACLPALMIVWLMGLAAPTAWVVTDLASAEHITQPGEPGWAPGTQVLRPWVESSPRSKGLMEKDLRSMVMPIFRVPEFLVGALLGRLLLASTALQRRRAALFVIPAILLVVALLAMSDRIPKPLLRNGLLAPLFCAVIFGMSGGGSWIERVLSSRAFVPLGEASYSVYILQSPVAQILSFEGGSIPSFIGYCLLLVGASLVSFFKIETPIRKRLTARLLSPRIDVQLESNAGRGTA
jgi:peptidoglycan/LPS O-acetylase OafA/YrhL